MEDSVLLAADYRYKGNMAKISQKKSEQVLVMLVPDTFERLTEIARAEDRPLGYVARELMIRGLHLYAVDGALRDNLADLRSEVDAERKQTNGKIVGQILPGKKPTTKDDVRLMYQKESEIREIGEQKPDRKKKAS